MDINAAIDAVRLLPPRAAIAREAARLRREELDGSLAITGTPLTRGQLDALLDRGLATGEHRLESYLAARDLAAGAAWVAEQRPLAAADPRPLLTIEDVRRLHALATAGQPALRPGIWRLGVVPATDGVVSPPPWLVAKETGALIDRFRQRPPTAELPARLAVLLGRFARIRPFAAANGRTARLAASLLLRRLDMPAPAIGRRRAAAYLRAVLAAESGKPAALAELLAETLLGSCRRLIAAAGEEALEPLRALAGERYAALIKAAKRGRLAAVERDGRIFTTAAWIEAYRKSSGRTSEYSAPTPRSRSVRPS